MPKVEAGTVAVLELAIQEDGGEMLDVFTAARPSAYLHGSGNLVPGLEAHLEGKEPGAAFDLVLEPEQAYGVPNGKEPQPVPRKEFRRDVDLRPGMSFVAEGTGGTQARLWITRIRGSRVWVDANHPWAGKTVRFTGKILAIRPATQSEREHGHAHGAGGHQH